MAMTPSLKDNVRPISVALSVQCSSGALIWSPLADQAYTLLKAAPKGEGYLYSPNCLEEVFSETQWR